MEKGFTLLELLTAVAIAALLVSIAVPTYGRYLLVTRRHEAALALAEVEMEQERWRALHSRYAGLEELGIGAVTRQRNFTITVTHQDAVGYTAAASALGRQQQDGRCARMTLIKSMRGTERDPAECWR